jgi:hypothetical protein
MSTTTMRSSTAPAGPAGWVELASRANDGLEITLLWHRSSGHVKVAVADLRRDRTAEFEVTGADALAAFHHPFAYAGEAEPPRQDAVPART